MLERIVIPEITRLIEEKRFDEIKKIREAGEKRGVKVDFVGERPTMEEINLAKKGRIDAL